MREWVAGMEAGGRFNIGCSFATRLYVRGLGARRGPGLFFEAIAMAGIIGRSALAFGVMSEKRLAVFAVSALGFVAVVLVGFWLVLGLAD